MVTLEATEGQQLTSALVRLQRLAVKGHITDLDKAVNSLCDEVVKEREASTQAITHLATAIAHHESTPSSTTAEEDPLVVRYTAEGQMRSQVIRENEALTAALVWQDKTKHFEAELLESIRFCWNCYETEQ